MNEAGRHGMDADGHANATPRSASPPRSTEHNTDSLQERAMFERRGDHGGTTRRQFLFQLAGAGAGAAGIGDELLGALTQLQPTVIDSPLSNYPNRDWERVYRDLYRSDSSFTFLCAPNDTHNCLLRGYVKNGIVTRIAPTYGYQHATDLNGNKASQRWDPRCCQKGLALVRRFYGDRRCKRPLVRRGFKQWVEDGCPRDATTGAVDADKYLDRGADTWVEATWDEAFDLTAKAMVNIAKTYSGDEGKQRLLAQGYDPLMVDQVQGAGTQVLKFRGGMPPLGMTRVFAQYREANAMALLDDKIRGTGPEGAVAGRGWDNYSWHTDLPPGHPMVTGQQTNDFDLCNVEHSNLALVWGMNWICTKMPDAHWLTEARMKGHQGRGHRGRVFGDDLEQRRMKRLSCVPARRRHSPWAWLTCMIKENLYRCQRTSSRPYTDLPLLVRMDTGKMLRASMTIIHRL